MAAANFAAALDAVLRHEGGYADHPADPGGATNLGVTRATLARWRGRAVSKAEVKALTRAEASRIYRAFYWDAVCADALAAGVDLCVFDHAVNSGPLRAVRTLQKILGVTADGLVGPRTLARAAARDPPELIGALCRARLSFLERLGTFAVFGRGWTRRVRETERLARAMASTLAPHSQQET